MAGMVWWQWLLTIAAAFLLALFLCVLALLLWLRAKWRGLKEALGGLAGALAHPAIPQTVVLHAAEEKELEKRPALRSACDDFDSLGFEVGGPFTVEGLDGSLLIPFADVQRQVVATALDSPEHGVVLDIVTFYEDGSAMTHTTLPDQGLRGPPERPKVRLPGASPTQLLERHLGARPAGVRKTIALAEVPAVLKQAVEEEWFWRAVRGGATDEELALQVEKAQAESPEDLKDPEARRAATAMTRSMIRSQAESFVQEKLLEQFQRETSMSVHEWEQVEDRLVFVHEAADVRELRGTCGPQASLIPTMTMRSHGPSGWIPRCRERQGASGRARRGRCLPI